MKSQRIRLTAAALLLLAAQAPALAPGSKTIRPEVGQPLQDAQKALQAKTYAAARTDISKADGVTQLPAHERYEALRIAHSDGNTFRSRGSPYHLKTKQKKPTN